MALRDDLKAAQEALADLIERALGGS